MMTLEDVLGFARSSAGAAFDTAGDYPSLQDAIDGYRENIRDTLKDERCAEHEEAAWAVYDAEVAKLTRGRQEHPANTFLRDLEAAQALKAQLYAARNSLSSRVAAGVAKLAPVGSVIDRRTTTFGSVNVTHGNGRNALCFEVASAPVVDLDLAHPGLSTFTVDAYPLNDAGKRMSGRVAKSYGLGRRETVQLRVSVQHSSRWDDGARQELRRLAELCDDQPLMAGTYYPL